MSYDLESSKRKLSRILSAISDSSRGRQGLRTTSDRAEVPEGAAPPAKRLKRFSSREPFGGLAGALIRNGSTASLRRANAEHVAQSGTEASTIMEKAVKTTAGDNVSPFNPSSRQDFLFRLRTFSHPSALNWATKPEAINEVAWARRGWTCCGTEVVLCLCCHKTLKVVFSGLELPSEDVDEDVTAEQRQTLLEEAISAVAKNMTDEHGSSCPWLHKYCDDTIYRLPVNHTRQALKDWKTRYDSLLALKDLLPQVDLSSYRNDASPIAVSKLAARAEHYLRSEADTTSTSIANGDSTDDAAHQTAFAMALMGLMGNERSQYASATCHACWRRVGFWLYRPRPGVEPTPDDPNLDLREAHREYCPWIDAETQNQGIVNDDDDAHASYKTKSLAGWETLLAKFYSLESDDRPTSAAPLPSDSTVENGQSSPLDDEHAHKERLKKWQYLKGRLSSKSSRVATQQAEHSPR